MTLQRDDAAIGCATAPPLRDYQAECVRHVNRAILRGSRRLYFELPTGTGKTRILGEVARQARRVGRVVAVAHTRELVTQLADGLSAGVGEFAGVVMAASDEPSAGLVVGSVQTLRGRRLDAVLEAGPVALLLLDECHHAHAGNSNGRLVERVAERWPDVVVLGCTATPYRADRHRMQDVLPVCAFTRSMPELAAAGWLAPLVWQRVEVDALELRSVRTGQGGGDADYRADELAGAVSRPGVAMATAALTAPLLASRRTVVFSADVAHAQALADAYRAQGVTAAAVWGDMPATDRVEVLDDWRTGRLQVVTNVNVVAEGFDLPELSACVNAAPTMSPGRFVQRVGRVSRTAPGKVDALVLDVTGGTFGEHSLDPRQITLPDLLGERPGETGSEVGVEQGEQLGGRRPHWLLNPTGASPIAWGFDEGSGCYYAAAGEGVAVLLRPDTAGSGLYVVVFLAVKGPAWVQTDGQAIPLRDAVGVAMAAAARSGRLSSLIDKGARWRADQATLAQLRWLDSLDRPAAMRAREAGASKGEVGLAITWALALRRLRDWERAT